MKEQRENDNIRPEPREKQNHYQKYRGHSLRILEELEHSGGLTTRQISDAIFGKVSVISSTINRLVHRCVIERVENWGWRITVTGLKILEIFFNKKDNRNNKTNNTIQTQTQHKINMKEKAITAEQEKELNKNAPSCFHESYCHIKKLLKKTVYNAETERECDCCAFWNANEKHSRSFYAPAGVQS